MLLDSIPDFFESLMAKIRMNNNASLQKPTWCAPVWAWDPLICCYHISGSSERENAAKKIFLVMLSHIKWDCCSQGSFSGTKVLAAAMLLQR